jgi:hypothetical protein
MQNSRDMMLTEHLTNIILVSDIGFDERDIRAGNLLNSR